MLKKQEVKLYLGTVVLLELLGALGAFVIRDGIAEYGMGIRPVMSPPAVLFRIVWTILYALMGIGLARIFSSEESMAKTIGLNLFWVQLFFNLMWGVFFFNLQAYGFALVWLLIMLLLIFMMILVWRLIDPVAAWLQIPYLLWVIFAAVLNASVWWMKK